MCPTRRAQASGFRLGRASGSKCPMQRLFGSAIPPSRVGISVIPVEKSFVLFRPILAARFLILVGAASAYRNIELFRWMLTLGLIVTPWERFRGPTLISSLRMTSTAVHFRSWHETAVEGRA